eukprot:14447928-Heterocapsa_arctica.AAC.1
MNPFRWLKACKRIANWFGVVQLHSGRSGSTRPSCRASGSCSGSTSGYSILFQRPRGGCSHACRAR